MGAPTTMLRMVPLPRFAGEDIPTAMPCPGHPPRLRGVIYLTEHPADGTRIPTGRRDEIEVTREMIEAGIAVLRSAEGTSDFAYVATAVFLAMSRVIDDPTNAFHKVEEVADEVSDVLRKASKLRQIDPNGFSLR